METTRAKLARYDYDKTYTSCNYENLEDRIRMKKFYNMEDI